MINEGAAVSHASLSQARYFLDATPLLDANWTGISIVCAAIARQLIARGLSLSFCLGRHLLPDTEVLEALGQSSGLYLARELETGRLRTVPLTWPRDLVSVGLSASVKRFNRIFNVECSWVHDISTLLQPEFHTADNIAWHSERIVDDLENNDITVCISEATKSDLITYLHADPTRLIVAHNGVEWPWWYPAKIVSEYKNLAEPYLVVLGTLEPRKNLSLVFDVLTSYPDILSKYRVIFVGQEGWMKDDVAIPPSLKSALQADKVTFKGYVSDYEKFCLLKGAQATLFPSFFEGFGLPVLESLSVGTPCIASFSSSLPEVGSTLCSYCDPFSPSSLHHALQNMLACDLKKDDTFASAAAAWSGRFTWNATMDTVLAALKPIIETAQDDRAKFQSVRR